MATAPLTTAAPETAPAKVPLLPILAAVVFTGLLSVGGAGGVMLYLAKSGKLKLPAAPAQKVEVQIEHRPEGPSHTVALEPMVVNLADAGGAAYLRLGLALRIMDDAGDKPKEEKPKAGTSEVDASLRDIALAVTGKQTSTMLLQGEGKARLKKELRDALVEQQPQLRVLDLYFTEFLVQR